MPHAVLIMDDSISGIPGTDFGTSGAIVIELTAVSLGSDYEEQEEEQGAKSLFDVLRALKPLELTRKLCVATNPPPWGKRRSSATSCNTVPILFLRVFDPSKEWKNTKVWYKVYTDGKMAD